jgi:hypothetical protein
MVSPLSGKERQAEKTGEGEGRKPSPEALTSPNPRPESSALSFSKVFGARGGAEAHTLPSPMDVVIYPW